MQYRNVIIAMLEFELPILTAPALRSQLWREWTKSQSCSSETWSATNSCRRPTSRNCSEGFYRLSMKKNLPERIWPEKERIPETFDSDRKELPVSLLFQTGSRSTGWPAQKREWQIWRKSIWGTRVWTVFWNSRLHRECSNTLIGLSVCFCIRILIF